MHQVYMWEWVYVRQLQKKWMNNFLFNPFNFCVTGRFLCTWSSIDDGLPTIKYTFTLLHLHIAKFRVQGCTYFQVITWNIKLVHSNESSKITASSFLSRKQVIIQFIWERKLFDQSLYSKNCLHFCYALFLEDLANWLYQLKQQPNSLPKAAQLSFQE